MDADSFTSLEGMQEDGGSRRSDRFEELIVVHIVCVWYFFYSCDVFVASQTCWSPVFLFWTFILFFCLRFKWRTTKANQGPMWTVVFCFVFFNQVLFFLNWRMCLQHSEESHMYVVFVSSVCYLYCERKERLSITAKKKKENKMNVQNQVLVNVMG